MASHTLSVLSKLPLTIRWPSGLKATLRTWLVCPFSVRVASPEILIPTLTSWWSSHTLSVHAVEPAAVQLTDPLAIGA